MWTDWWWTIIRWKWTWFHGFGRHVQLLLKLGNSWALVYLDIVYQSAMEMNAKTASYLFCQWKERKTYYCRLYNQVNGQISTTYISKSTHVNAKERNNNIYSNNNSNNFTGKSQKSNLYHRWLAIKPTTYYSITSDHNGRSKSFHHAITDEERLCKTCL